jgi:hypothetical protein
VAKELREAWIAEHGEETTPERMAAYYEALVQ